MSLFDKAKDFAGKNQDKIKEGLDKVGNKVDSATDGKYSDQINTAKDKVSEQLGDDEQQGGDQDGQQQGGPQQGGPGGDEQQGNQQQGGPGGDR